MVMALDIPRDNVGQLSGELLPSCIGKLEGQQLVFATSHKKYTAGGLRRISLVPGAAMLNHDMSIMIVSIQ